MACHCCAETAWGRPHPAMLRNSCSQNSPASPGDGPLHPNGLHCARAPARKARQAFHPLAAIAGHQGARPNAAPAHGLTKSVRQNRLLEQA